MTSTVSQGKVTTTDGIALSAGFDAIGFDLDGVVYRGPLPVPGAPETLNELHRRGIRLGYVTNNAQRPPKVVADQLTGFGIDCEAQDIVTSAQATARLMGEALPSGAEVLVVGSLALVDEVAAVGLVPAAQSSPDTAAVIVGFDPGLTWDQLNEGCYAVQRGAVFYACNGDLTRPTDKGLAPGTGAVLLAMGQALHVAPIMGGKPARPLLDEARRRLGAERPLFVGDRLDTDVEGAHVAGWASLFVLSGGNGPADLLAAPPARRPGYLAADVCGLLEAPRVAVQDGETWRCGQALAHAAFDLAVVVDGPLGTVGERLDALWAVAHVAWRWADEGVTVDAATALARIGDVWHTANLVP